MINEIFTILQNLSSYVQAFNADDVRDVSGAAKTLGSGLSTLILMLRNVVLALGFLFIIIGGIKFATGQGDPEKINSGKQTLLWALVAMIGATAFWVILRLLLGSIFGVQGLDEGGVKLDISVPNF